MCVKLVTTVHGQQSTSSGSNSLVEWIGVYTVYIQCMYTYINVFETMHCLADHGLGDDAVDPLALPLREDVPRRPRRDGQHTRAYT